MGKLQIDIPDDLHQFVREKCYERSSSKGRFSQERFVLECIEAKNQGKFQEPPKEAKECEHEWIRLPFKHNGVSHCKKCEQRRGVLEPTVVSKEEGIRKALQKDAEDITGIKVVKPKEKEHQPNCTCMICKPPKTK